MLNDLSKASPNSPANADVLVVGAGIAGLLLSTRLAARGMRVVVLESGALTQEGETHPLNEVVQLGSFYSGAEHGRFRCLGGTSSRWGGAMLPYLAADMSARPGADHSWPVAHGDLLAFLPQVEALFDLPPGPYEQPELVRSRRDRRCDFIPRLAKWPSFDKRNLAALFDKDVRSANGPEIWLNASATSFIFRPDGRLDAVKATGPGGRQIQITARETAIAAGAIESTRLLLLADLQQGCRLFTPDNVLGRYFYDHLSVEVAKIKPFSRKILNRVAGFRFQGRGMRNLRFEPAEREDVRAELSPGFAHIAFSTTEPTGFDVLRDLYRSLQRRDR
jgi:choline dehydrogenase-like flavoprotein